MITSNNGKFRAIRTKVGEMEIFTVVTTERGRVSYETWIIHHDKVVSHSTTQYDKDHILCKRFI